MRRISCQKSFLWFLERRIFLITPIVNVFLTEIYVAMTSINIDTWSIGQVFLHFMVFATTDAVARNMMKINELNFWCLSHLSETYLMYQKFALITREENILIYTNCQCFLTEKFVTVTSINIDTWSIGQVFLHHSGFVTADDLVRNVTKFNKLNFGCLLNFSGTYLRSKKMLWSMTKIIFLIYLNGQSFWNWDMCCWDATSINIDTW